MILATVCPWWWLLLGLLSLLLLALLVLMLELMLFLGLVLSPGSARYLRYGNAVVLTFPVVAAIVAVVGP